jgi:TRAP-type C4-dicarboxylate transport system permease small subunit
MLARIARLLAWIMDAVAAALLLALAVITLLDVIGRELHSLSRNPFFERLLGAEPLVTPIPGAVEWTVIFMAVSTYAVFAGISWRQEHVAVDLVDSIYPKRWIGLREALINLGAAAFLAVVAWALWQRAIRTEASGEVFQYLRVANAPFIYLFAGFTALASAVLVANAIRYAAGRGPLQRGAAAPPPPG